MLFPDLKTALGRQRQVVSMSQLSIESKFQDRFQKLNRETVLIFSKAEVMHYYDGVAKNTTKSKNLSMFLMYNTGKFL